MFNVSGLSIFKQLQLYYDRVLGDCLVHTPSIVGSYVNYL